MRQGSRGDLAPLLVAAMAIAAGCRKSPSGGTAPEASAPLPNHIAAYTGPTEEQDHERAELGRLLFFDTRLSGDGTKSCATCHDAQKGLADGRPRGIGANG